MNEEKYVKRKNFRKKIRVTFQILLLLSVAAILLHVTVFRQRYQHTAPPQQRDKGFIALSYFGVAPEGTETLIAQPLLRKHINALKMAGYTTISQQDIYDYYHNGHALPQKALFLFFEDGRRESSLLAQSILEENNYLASMLSYANNLDGRDSLFLSGENLRALIRSTFWEVGTHGYRLSYINVFDRHENFLGEMTPIEFYQVSQYIQRDYNHYLMDYLRNEYDIPMESYEQMQERIADEYVLMEQVYRKELDDLPGLYTLMHSNTGQFATNPRVSLENEKQITQYFDINFNREMLAVNNLQSEIYDLTRMQPQAYWPVNHLLMRLADDTGDSFTFFKGDADKSAQWLLVSGAAEFDGHTLNLTTPSRGSGIVHLQGSEGRTSFTLSTHLLGNKLGTQAVDLWLDKQGEEIIAIEIVNNILRIRQINKEQLAELPPEDGGDRSDEILFDLPLDKLDNIIYQTWEENRQEALTAEIEAKKRQTYKPEDSAEIVSQLELTQRRKGLPDNTAYIPELTLKEKGNRRLNITCQGGLLSVWIDEKPAVLNLELPEQPKGGLALRSTWGEYGYSQRNIADDVYDAVFKDLLITPPGINDEAEMTEKAYVDYREIDIPSLLDKGKTLAVEIYEEIRQYLSTLFSGK